MHKKKKSGFVRNISVSFTWLLGSSTLGNWEEHYHGINGRTFQVRKGLAKDEEYKWGVNSLLWWLDGVNIYGWRRILGSS